VTHSRQGGAALLIVLMLLAIMSAMAAEMTLSFQAQLQRTQMVNQQLQRHYDIDLAEQLALANLMQDKRDNDQQTTAHQYWAQPQIRHLPTTGNTLRWQLHDAQNCFNINALATVPVESLDTPPYPLKVFTALMLNAGFDRSTSDELAQSIADYIDTDDSPRLHGAEDDYYLLRTPPRLSAGQPLFLISELRDIKGMTDKIYQKIVPYLCARPTNQLAININSLTEKNAPLLMALFLNDITESDALALLHKQPEQGWQTADAFLYWAQQDHSTIKPLLSDVKTVLTTSSEFFFLDVSSSGEGQSQGWRSHIYYNPKQRVVDIYQRSLLLAYPE
jgi:general secretion pathway protein K